MHNDQYFKNILNKKDKMINYMQILRVKIIEKKCSSSVKII